MPSYKAPLEDMKFLLHEVWNRPDLYPELEPSLLDSILEEAARFNENILHPLNQIGDKEGCSFNKGQVTTPRGFKEAYKQYVEAGWLSLNAPETYGGQGLPKMLQLFIDEMLASSNVSFSLYCVLTQGTVHALELHGTEHLKNLYLPKLVSGEWGGTMCLTEPHCGTDLSLVKTKAEPQTDGTYKISGTKIFITSGEHDLTENIIHTVLARIPGSPPGIKGISLFLVPKYHANADRTCGSRNAVTCGSIEHKMGIRGSSTCVMNFDGATGYLMGEANQGMRAMFDMMNLERINIGLEGLALAEASYQNALAYAKDRLQGRKSSGPAYPDKAADPLLVHPDVRRMLLTMKAYNEGARALLTWAGMQIDIAEHCSDTTQRQYPNNFVDFITPIIKAFFTDYGFEACNLGLQILGGHGYIQEWGQEQLVRDARIAQIYEGANGIQALDLVKRKVIMNKGAYVQQLANEINEFIQQTSASDMVFFTNKLKSSLDLWLEVTQWIIDNSSQDADLAGACSVDYLKFCGLVCFAYMWAKMVHVSLQHLNKSNFYSTKIKTAQFFYDRLLPEIDSLKLKIYSGASNLMTFAESEF
jgi:alkylation response protein AidB-like acyl-CoA dehydrogenase